jgi:hypothetical protein
MECRILALLFPTTIRVVVAARNGHVPAFNNLRGLPPPGSRIDTLCRLTTAGVTDQDEILFAAADRPGSRMSSPAWILPIALSC